MTREQFLKLTRGDIVRSASGRSYIVSAHYGEHAIAVDAIDISNPQEWTLIHKTSYDMGDG